MKEALGKAGNYATALLRLAKEDESNLLEEGGFVCSRVFHNCTFSEKNKSIAVRTPPGCI